MSWPISCSRAVSRPAASLRYLSTSVLSLGFLPPFPFLPLLSAIAPLRSSDLVIIVHADGVVGAGKRHLRHGRGFHGERGKVFRFEAVHARLAAGARQHLRFERKCVQEIVDALGRLIGIETLAQLRVLRRDAHRAAPSMTVIAMAGRNADLVLEI